MHVELLEHNAPVGTRQQQPRRGGRAWRVAHSMDGGGVGADCVKRVVVARDAVTVDVHQQHLEGAEVGIGALDCEGGDLHLA